MLSESLTAVLADSVPVDTRQLLDRCLGNRGLALRVLDKFATSFPADWSELQRSHSQNDAAALARLAHRLKGSAASVSATELAHWGARLEQLARTQQLEHVPEVLRRLEEAWTRFLEYRTGRDGGSEGFASEEEPTQTWRASWGQ